MVSKTEEDEAAKVRADANRLLKRADEQEQSQGVRKRKKKKKNKTRIPSSSKDSKLNQKENKDLLLRGWKNDAGGKHLEDLDHEVKEALHEAAEARSGRMSLSDDAFASEGGSFKVFEQYKDNLDEGSYESGEEEDELVRRYVADIENFLEIEFQDENDGDNDDDKSDDLRLDKWLQVPRHSTRQNSRRKSRVGFMLSTILVILVVVVVFVAKFKKSNQRIEIHKYKSSHCDVSSTNTISSEQVKGFLIDGNNQTWWSSEGYEKSDEREWIAFWLEDGAQTIDCVELWPRPGDTIFGFPAHYQIKYSKVPSHGIWTDIMESTQQPEPNTPLVLVFPEAVVGDGLHIVTSDLGHADGDTYSFQLAEATACYTG